MCWILVGWLAFPVCSGAQVGAEKEIQEVLARQTVAWNEGDLARFMVGYWQSDGLLFVGKSGLTYGYRNTLENYKRSYASKAEMGELAFELLEFRRLGRRHYLVVGKWHLERGVGNLEGHFSLLFERKGGAWVIVADHSS